MLRERFRLVMFISGGGSTALSIVNACKTGRLKRIDPVYAICSNTNAGGAKKLFDAGINVFILNPKQYTSYENFGHDLRLVCLNSRPHIIGQYGWLPLTPRVVIESGSWRMINQHPGPLDPGFPDFGGKGMYGRRVHAARLLYARLIHNDFWTEATAQFVAPEFDKGAVFHQRKVEITEDDDPISLQQRVLPVEHEVQIEALELLAEGRAQKFVRSERLVPAHLQPELTLAKRMAGLLFPHG